MKRKKIKSVWKEYLTLSMRERKGLSILLGILLFQVLFLFYLNNSELKYPVPDLDAVKKLQSEISKPEFNNIEAEIAVPSISNLKAFDPNTLTADQWIQFGLSEKQSNSVLNYLKKGGRFRTKKDLLKIYGMNEKLFATLLPFIALPDSLIYQRNAIRSYERKKFEPLDINKADSIQLEKLKGIGPTLAGRIIKYRDKLGGFVMIEQLREVYGVNDTLFDFVRDQITLQSIEVRQLNLNTDSFPEFSAHPYIGRKLAGMILNYRKQHQRYESADELKNLPLLTDEIFRKLAPYLKVD